MTSRARTFLTLALLLMYAHARAGELPARPRFVYGGDARFAPYDYRDTDGVLTGFNVELMRAVAREAGVHVEVRLATWNDVRAEFDAGGIDIISLSYSEERAQAYDWLEQTWWMHQCVLFRAGRAGYPRSPAELAGETVAVQERSAVAELLFRQVPPKPLLITVPTQDDALAMLERGMASGVGGNSLSLRVAAAERGIDALAEMPLRAVPYGYMVRKGRATELGWVRMGLARLRKSGAIEALAERYLAVPPPRRSRDRTVFAAVFLGLAFAIATAVALRNRAREMAAERQARSERERMDGELARAETEWQRTVDAVDTCVVILDGNCRIKRINRAAREIIGQDESLIVGRHIEQLEATEPWLTAARLLRSARVGPPPSAEATDVGTGKTWDLTVFRAPDKQGADQPIIVNARDVTRVVALRGALRQSETMSALGALVAGVAHEIRNPLFSISATIDALEDDFGNHAEYVEGGHRLRKQVARLTRLTRDLLEYSRSPTLTRASIKARELLGGAVDACADRARERGVHLLLQVAPHLPALEVDVGRMEQVVQNLIANAVEHSPRGRTVRVAAQLGPVAETVELSVADQGLGLAEDDVPRLFEPFFSRREGGTGLGLSIVHRIVESHGGRVTAANQRSGGAVFTVILPVDVPPPGAGVPASAPASSSDAAPHPSE